MVANKKEDTLSDKEKGFFIFLTLTIFNVILWIVALCGNDLHYRNVGAIKTATPYDTVIVQNLNKAQTTKVLYEYRYIDDWTGEELVQTSEDIDSFINMGTEDHIRKHDRKYFYEYRIWTNHLIYICFAIFFIHICFKIANT